MNVLEICTREVVTCSRHASALEMAQLMRQYHVGDLIVVDGTDGKSVPVGIVTDRDLVVQVMAKGVSPEMLSAADVMSDELRTVLESEAVYDAIWHMRSQGIRRLPVVDARGSLLGVVTADDVTGYLAAELTEVSRISPRQIELEEDALTPIPM
ncbi:MAG TPA: CBS domain-containing protein [Albitalea sp.]|nr:CBS domain-containing protein [Albitalea sp.]